MVSSYVFRVSPDALGFSLEESGVVKNLEVYGKVSAFSKD